MKKKKPKLNKFIRFTSIAFQMGVTIYLASLLGEWLDKKFENENGLYLQICTLVGVFIAMYAVIREVLKMSKE